MSGWSNMASTVSLAPLTRLTTPSGNPLSSNKPKTFCIVSGTRSDGLTMTVLPQARAYGMNQKGIIPGKLKGATIAHTPTGWRIISSSIPLAISSEISPIIMVGIPQATSTFSIARRISPRDSPMVLPHSLVIVRASSSNPSSMSAFSLKRCWIRSGAGTRRQWAWAWAATRAASSTSAPGDTGTFPKISAVAGLITSRYCEADDGRHSPPM